MGTPERVSSEPNLPVPLPCLSPHQVAILVRGLDRHLEILGRLRVLHVGRRVRREV